VLFLANIVPALQASVLDQCEGPRWTALDSMDLWIEIARDDLVAVIERVDCLVLNDAELRQLTGKPSIVGAARDVLAIGPGAVIANQGEYGAVLVTADGFFSMPAFPLENVVDPTRRRHVRGRSRRLPRLAARPAG
jgi:sugar/nucleoside kinase (ribokinase family)